MVECVPAYLQDKQIKAQCVIVLTDGYLGGSWGEWHHPLMWVILDNKRAVPSVGKAVLSAGVATVNGVATGSYRDNGCAGTDVITATAAGVTSPSTSLVVAPPTTGSIQFVSASPGTISLRGIGGTEAAQVRFRVLDGAGNPIGGKTVTFGLTTTLGGITLVPTPATAVSDANGMVGTPKRYGSWAAGKRENNLWLKQRSHPFP